MSTNKLRAIRIGIILNSPPEEDTSIVAEQYVTSHQVSDEIVEVLTGHGAEVVKIDASGNLYERLRELIGKIDIIFNIANDMYQFIVPMTIDQLHLEMDSVHMAYTAAKAEGHILALNKALARRVLGDRVQQPAWQYLKVNDQPQTNSISFPVLVKPVGEGQSIGIDERSIARSVSDLEQSLDRLRKRLGGAMIVESFLNGVEYSMGMVGDVVMPAVSWDLDQLPGKPLVRGEGLKLGDLTTPHAKLVTEPTLATALATQVIKAHTGLGLRDYSRSDFRAKRGEPIPYFLETNSGPGLQKHESVLPWAAENAGVAYGDLIGSIIAQTLLRMPKDIVKQLDTDSFEKAYDRLRTRAKSGKVIHLNGREFYLLQPVKQQD